ncbi:MoaD/ThiS family protein [Synechococcus sp. C9]|jgi:molybdopterin synthase sulfur carrier subunit|uniref:MoaD/ThiS family protein n=1 Tax=Synechococcus sp. C9 TaxID=102119 RepID=UPI001FF49426|nr:MoaD/ThiS family protein [Synechococcus sp. C9]
MAVRVLIPTPLQKLTQERDMVECEADSVSQLVESLEQQWPGMKNRLCDESGQIRRFVNVFVNSEDIRFLQGRDTPLRDGDEVSIVPAIAGG